MILEHELAEHLWAAGVREGGFLAHVAAAIVGRELIDDPGWHWFGGAFDQQPELDSLADWADDEVAGNLYRALERQRLRPPSDELLSWFPCVTSAPDSRTARGVSRTAAALCQLWCARLEVEPSRERMREQLRMPGRLERGDALRVVIPMNCVDIDLRRAGLDIDPGHVPWVNRRVEIIFEDGA